LPGNEATLNFYLTNYTALSSLVSAVRGIQYFGGNTNTTGGLRLTRTEIFNTANGDRRRVPNVIVLITDGVPTREVGELWNEVRRVKNAGIRIVAVGITNAVSRACFQNCYFMHIQITLCILFCGLVTIAIS